MKYADRISTPSPEPLKKRSRYTSIRQPFPPPPSNRSNKQNQNKSKQGKKFTRRSLSTIAEESGSYHSASLNNVEITKSHVSEIKI